MGNLSTGKIGEAMAAAYLEAAGYRIVERNYRCPLGEIDLIALEGDTLVFVEVKSRRSENYGLPQLAVGPGKQRRISKISLYYLQSLRLDPASVRVEACRGLFADHAISRLCMAVTARGKKTAQNRER